MPGAAQRKRRKKRRAMSFLFKLLYEGTVDFNSWYVIPLQHGLKPNTKIGHLRNKRAEKDRGHFLSSSQIFMKAQVKLRAAANIE